MIRKSEFKDTERVVEIYELAKAGMRDMGIDQWQDGYPSEDIIAEDITRGIGYVACALDNTVLGYEAVVFTGEEAYSQLPDEAWHTPSDYVVVHRLCVDGNSRRRGIAIELMNFAREEALRRNITAFRIDTHKGNTRMLSLLHKLGFEHVGVVRYDSGEREAFDINLNIK